MSRCWLAPTAQAKARHRALVDLSESDHGHDPELQAQIVQSWCAMSRRDRVAALVACVGGMLRDAVAEARIAATPMDES